VESRWRHARTKDARTSRAACRDHDAGVLNFVLDSGQVQVIVRQLRDAVPSGSYLAISHPATEVDAEPIIQAVSSGPSSARPR
jgi:S-adenosyl methyltransferase